MPVSVSKFLSGGILTALNSNKPKCPADIHPIAVDETLHHLIGKCFCAVTKVKTSEYFAPHQMGVACTSGAKKSYMG